jgi:K+-transporting ATPase, c chain
MLSQIRPAIVLLVLVTMLTGLAYPLAVTGIAQVLFPHQAAGSLEERNGKIIGSELIGQSFTEAKYFHGRPSATTDTDPNDATKSVPAPYNAGNSGGSNAGPTSKALIERVKGDVESLKLPSARRTARGFDDHRSGPQNRRRDHRLCRGEQHHPDHNRQIRPTPLVRDVARFGGARSGAQERSDQRACRLWRRGRAGLVEIGEDAPAL